jgi:hypothetical protein
MGRVLRYSEASWRGNTLGTPFQLIRFRKEKMEQNNKNSEGYYQGPVKYIMGRSPQSYARDPHLDAPPTPHPD